jgi:CubicO group peptidase (beta-lactamase class C family)
MLADGDPAEVGVDARVLDGPLRSLLARNRTRAAALVVRGRLVWERYFDGCDAGTRFHPYSVTKGLVAIAVGLLEAEGRLGLDEPACRFLNAWAGDARREITVRHLLTMTSGLALQYERFVDAPDASVAALGWPLVHRPGKVWCYEQATAQALVPVVMRASGCDLFELLRERVLEPIGARDVGWARAPGGDCLGYVGVHVTARDLCRVGELLLNRGRFEGREVIALGFVERMLALDACTAAARAHARDEARRRAYGFLVYANRAGLWPGVDREAFALLGAWGNACLVDPRHEMVFVRLVTPADREGDAALDGNALDVTDHGTAKLWRAVLRAFDGDGTVADRLRRRLDGARWEARGSLAMWARRHGVGF